MKRDYLVYPSMIRAQSGVIWSYDNASVVSSFSETDPLHVSANECDDSKLCLWYVSALQTLNDSLGTKYALLGEWNKWTAVSQQRFKSIVTNVNKNQVMITVQGFSWEIVPIVIYHSALLSVTINCAISAATNQAHLIITPTNISCS